MTTEVTTRTISPEDGEIKNAQQLYYSAFPPEERIEDGHLVALIRSGHASLLAIDAVVDNRAYPGAGYAYIILSADAVGYLLFFAVFDEWRGKGIGSAFLTHLKDLNVCSQIVLDVENTGVTDAPNLGERIGRKNFYLERGFHETPYTLLYEGETYEVLCTADSVNLAGFRETIEQLNKLGSEISFI